MEKYKEIARLIEKGMNSTLTKSQSNRLNEWKNSSERNLKFYNRISDPAYWEKVRKIDLEAEWQKVITPRAPKCDI